MEEDMIGAIKIKDGLFIGDIFVAKDLDFLSLIKFIALLIILNVRFLTNWLCSANLSIKVVLLVLLLCVTRTWKLFWYMAGLD